MTLRLGDTVPDFLAETTEGPIQFYEFLGKRWGVLFSHPADFTPVCATELGAPAKLQPEFAARNVKVIGLSVDPLDSHTEWIDDINATQQTTVNFPIVADSNRAVAEAYDMIHPNSDDATPVRSVFVIDPNKTLRLSLAYPPSAGRNFDEILRVSTHCSSPPTSKSRRRQTGNRGRT